jgi:hypothetical protein
MHQRFFIDETDERTSRFEDGSVVKIPLEKNHAVYCDG